MAGRTMRVTGPMLGWPPPPAADAATTAASAASTAAATSESLRVIGVTSTHPALPAASAENGFSPQMRELSLRIRGACERASEVCPRMTQLLLIEDDSRIRGIVERGLRARGFSVCSAPDAASAIRAMRAHDFDLVLLDLMLPDADGFSLLGAIRAAKPRLPVIAVTARDDLRSKLDGLDGGADDYVTKPFSIAELDARIRSRLRWRDDNGGLLEAGPPRVHLVTHRATLDRR